MANEIDKVKEIKREIETFIADKAVELLRDYDVYIDDISVTYNTQHVVGNLGIKYFSDVYVELKL